MRRKLARFPRKTKVAEGPIDALLQGHELRIAPIRGDPHGPRPPGAGKCPRASHEYVERTHLVDSLRNGRTHVVQVCILHVSKKLERKMEILQSDPFDALDTAGELPHKLVNPAGCSR
jgi:hypothetical protein